MTNTTSTTTQRIGVSVDKTLWKEFTEIIERKYGQSRYFLSLEVNEALEEHIRLMKGELVLKVAGHDSDPTVYAHIDSNSSDTMVVQKFKEKIITPGFRKIDNKYLKKFVVDECGFTSRTKYYDVRDELLAKDLIAINKNKKDVFNIIAGDLND